jgi:hypothetical protein
VSKWGSAAAALGQNVGARLWKSHGVNTWGVLRQGCPSKKYAADAHARPAFLPIRTLAPSTLMPKSCLMQATPTVRTFAPELWGQIDRFGNLYSETFTFRNREKKALSGAINHFRKALYLRALSVKLKPNLMIDLQQLEEKGYTPAENSLELSAVIEVVFAELLFMPRLHTQNNLRNSQAVPWASFRLNKKNVPQSP